MAILQLNLHKHHKFLISGLLFGFCMARIVTCIMRIVWATRPTNIRIAIAAIVFTTAGVLIVFIVNVIFAQRVLRAAHPHIGWQPAIHYIFLALYILIVFALAMVITVSIQSLYTLNPHTRRIDRDVQLAVSTYLTFFAFLPIPMVLIGLIIPRKTRLDKFGSGTWRTKIRTLLVSAALMTLGAGFRCGTAWMPPRPVNNPAWYHAKWCFYFFNFVLEIIVIYMYIVLRVDRRFHIPDHAKGPGALSERPEDKEVQATRDSSNSERRIMSEDEVFDDESPEDIEKTRLPKDVEVQ
jgi:hypothetical protein